MIPIFRSGDRNRLFARLQRRRAQLSGEVLRAVRRIIARVRKEGDRALLDLTWKHDGVRMSASQMRVDPERLKGAAAKADPAVVRELERALFNIHAYHRREVQKSWEFSRRGVRLGQRVTPLESVGVYVPGGSAAYPSTVLMNVIPAKIAGVQRIVAVTPPGTFRRHPIIAAALRALQVHEVYLVGGAQAVAALAYGTRTIPRVAKIVGPGNLYVAAAKREVYGDVDIDMVAGPSEIVVLAGTASNPKYIAADMLAQAEHDPAASALCFTDSMPHALMVQREIERQLERLPRRQIAGPSLASFGGIVVYEDLIEAARMIDEIAPEHLEILSAVPESIAGRIAHAGAIFIGDHSPEAVGDYFAGSNHVLPTTGTARFFSPLGVYHFQRRTSVIRYTREELRRTWRSIAVLARAEGLEGHAWSVAIREDERPVEKGGEP